MREGKIAGVFLGICSCAAITVVILVCLVFGTRHLIAGLFGGIGTFLVALYAEHHLSLLSGPIGDTIYRHAKPIKIGLWGYLTILILFLLF